MGRSTFRHDWIIRTKPSYLDSVSLLLSLTSRWRFSLGRISSHGCKTASAASWASLFQGMGKERASLFQHPWKSWDVLWLDHFIPSLFQKDAQDHGATQVVVVHCTTLGVAIYIDSLLALGMRKSLHISESQFIHQPGKSGRSLRSLPVLQINHSIILWLFHLKWYFNTLAVFQWRAHAKLLKLFFSLWSSSSTKTSLNEVILKRGSRGAPRH